MKSIEYYREVIAFYYANERNPLPTSAISLWHALLFINSNIDGADEFTATGPVLRTKAGLPLTSFKRARRILVEKGYIEYQSRGNLPPVYRIKRLSSVNDWESSRGWSLGDSFLEIMHKQKANLERRAKELKISHEEKSVGDGKEILEQYQKEQL